jgi:hypothetical protein
MPSHAVVSNRRSAKEKLRLPRLRSRQALPAPSAQAARAWHTEYLPCYGFRGARCSTASTRAASATAVDLTMKLVGKPDAGNRQVPPSLTIAIAAKKARRDESVQSGERIITVIPCEAAESSPELQIRTTQLPREGSPPSGFHYFRQSCHGISVIARPRIRRFESNMPSQPVRTCVPLEGHRDLLRPPCW